MTVSTDNYIITHLNNHPEYDVLVTLLDYEIRITDYFKILPRSESDKTLVLIDTALCPCKPLSFYSSRTKCR